MTDSQGDRLTVRGTDRKSEELTESQGSKQKVREYRQKVKGTDR